MVVSRLLNLIQIYIIVLSALVLTCVESNLYAQLLPGGVSIAEDTLAPHPSAILDIRSINKGVLIPRMSYEDMLALGQITGLPLGTTVFVTVPTTEEWYRQQLRGLYVFKNATANASPSFVKLEIKRVQYPVGSIMFYSPKNATDITNNFVNGKGKVNTAMEGWAICDGNVDNDVPDLRARFIVGAQSIVSDYSKVGNTGGYSFLYGPKYRLTGMGVIVDVNSTNFPNITFPPQFPFTKDNLFQHRHPVNSATTVTSMDEHSHTFTDNPHYHTVRTTHKGAGNGASKKQSDQLMDRDDAKRTGKPWKRRTVHLGNVNDPYDGYSSAKIEIIKVSTPVLTDEFNQKIKDAGNGMPLDNRPPYYVGVYLMKIGSDGKGTIKSTFTPAAVDLYAPVLNTCTGN